ncbi:glycosyltransferase family 2 protein [Thalassolituus sp. LLYu03]|uniref:glycosyltransferase family 2 protein n=1 Tax=Thalassolituus sp. LLYu03 TaxID=3421656 RepID=UPI003D26538F
MIKPTVICLTPVKNEEWILEKFLAAASLWADVIIVADQNSTDLSRDIVRSFPKARLILNDSSEFNEPERQKLLIDEARKIPGKRLLIALDADEFLSGDAWNSDEWNRMLEQEEGTIFKFKWPFVSSDFSYCWAGDRARQPFACMDADELLHGGSIIHSCRVPILNHKKVVEVESFSVMHFQFTDWQRMESKHRWYQCYERITFPNKTAIEIFRRYSHMYRLADADKSPMPSAWLENYLKFGIDLKHIKKIDKYYWDAEIEKMKSEYGVELFKYIDLPENDNLMLRYLRATRSWNYSLVERAFSRFVRLFS